LMDGRILAYFTGPSRVIVKTITHINTKSYYILKIIIN
jgi:hypothetical protein